MVAQAIPIASDLIQFARPGHIVLHRQDFFARVVTLLSARLPVASPA
jgi:hypothetical protein